MRLIRAIASAVVIISMSGMLALALTSHPGDPPCVPKPYPVTIDLSKFPPEMHEGLLKFVDDMNYKIIDEIYLRFCNYILDSIYQVTACSLNVDSIFPCVSDSLYTFFDAINIRGTGSPADGGGAGILFYEDTSQGGQYAGFRAHRDDGSLYDTSDIEASYVLVMPKDDGNQEDQVMPSGFGYEGSAGAGSANSELLSDGTGNLYWIDRDWFTRVMLDSLIADTGDSFGHLVVEAEIVFFKSDTNRTIDGKWGGSQLKLRWSEDVSNGGGYLEMYPDPDIQASWTFVWPDSNNPYEGGIWRFNNASSNSSPYWAPYDDEFILRGTDSIPCSETSTEIFWRQDAIHDANRDSSVIKLKMDGRTVYQVYVSWARKSTDSSVATDGDGTYGCPDFDDPRYGQLGVIQTSDLTYIDDKTGTFQGGVFNKSDSSFVVHTPAFGCDTTKIITWMVVGRLTAFAGTGH